MFISTVAKTLPKIAKLTPMVGLGNRTYRAWGVLELPELNS